MDNRDLTYAELNRTRRSWSVFTGEVVPLALVEEILDEASLAPSASNLQPWRFVVVQGEQLDRFADALGGNLDKARAAGTLILVFADPNVVDERDHAREFYDGGRSSRRDFAVRNGSLVAMNVLLAAWSHGVATRPMIGFEPFLVTEAAKVPRHWVPVLAIAAGRPDLDRELPERQRHAVSDLVTILE